MSSRLLISLFINGFFQHCFTVFNVIQTFQTDLVESSTQSSLVIHNSCSIEYPVFYQVPIYPEYSEWYTSRITPNINSETGTESNYRKTPSLRLCYDWNIWKSQRQTICTKVVAYLGVTDKNMGSHIIVFMSEESIRYWYHQQVTMCLTIERDKKSG